MRRVWVGHTLGLTNEIRVHIGAIRSGVGGQTYLRNGHAARPKMHSIQVLFEKVRRYPERGVKTHPSKFP